MVETHRKIPEEVGYARVITIAEDGLSSEMVFVVFQFSLDVGQLCVELVFLG